jgi:hypothetical protein
MAPLWGSAAAEWVDEVASVGDYPNRWQLLERELDCWQAANRRATLWWRDDDACRDSAALRKLLAIAGQQRVPVALAAIPAEADRTLADAIASCAHATIVQHGYAHRNHAPRGERSAELGADRPLAVRLAELEQGRQRLEWVSGARYVPVLVPPWNRIAGDIYPRLVSVGLRGLSCFGPRGARLAAPALPQVNTHVDLIAWRRDRLFIGADAAIGRLVAHLTARRLFEVDADEPSGILTHHLVLADAAWDFVRELCSRTRSHPAAAWLDVAHIFEPSTEDEVTSVRSA